MHITIAAIEKRSIPEPNSGCWLWLLGHCLDGYGRMFWERRRSMRAHRASWIAHHGAIPDGMAVCHKCDVRSCVNPAHLFLGTIADNNADCRSKGRWVVPLGEAHGQSKLTAAQAAAVFLDPRSLNAIARDYGIAGQSVSAIKRGKNWRSVTHQLQPASDAARDVSDALHPIASHATKHGEAGDQEVGKFCPEVGNVSRIHGNR